MAQVLCALGNILKIIAIQFKSKKKILICFCFVNLLVGFGLLLLGGISGSIVCFVASIQTFINYLYCDKKLPKYLIPIYILVSFLIGIFTCKEILDVVPIICSLLYIASISQKNESKLRILSLINILCWIVYNLSVGAYADVAFKVIFCISNIISIIRYDIKK